MSFVLVGAGAFLSSAKPAPTKLINTRLTTQYLCCEMGCANHTPTIVLEDFKLI
ncbi:hypothetical protein ACP6PM_05585 [Dapis sp. BLCC M229]